MTAALVVLCVLVAVLTATVLALVAWILRDRAGDRRNQDALVRAVIARTPIEYDLMNRTELAREQANTNGERPVIPAPEGLNGM